LQPPPLHTTRLHAYGGNGNNFTTGFRLWRATHLRASAGAWAAAAAAFQLASALCFCFAARAPSHERALYPPRHGAAICSDARLTEAEIAEERFLGAP
jgi:hypothetical protein